MSILGRFRAIPASLIYSRAFCLLQKLYTDSYCYATTDSGSLVSYLVAATRALP